MRTSVDKIVTVVRREQPAGANKTHLCFGAMVKNKGGETKELWIRTYSMANQSPKTSENI